MSAKITWDRELHYQRRVAPLVNEAPWVLRVTQWKGKPSPLFLLRQRRTVPLESQRKSNRKGKRNREDQPTFFGPEKPADRTVLHDRGLCHGDAQRRCLPVLRAILARVPDLNQAPLELERFLPQGRIEFRGNLPLDEEAGSKLALIFKLQERIKDLDRVELVARRVERFTREEAAYWLSRITNFGADANRWAVSGLRIVLGGQPKDKAVGRMLEKLRSR
jgi:hypothetical protein